eukprot:3522159-Rhodomonas_salina.1
MTTIVLGLGLGLLLVVTMMMRALMMNTVCDNNNNNKYQNQRQQRQEQDVRVTARAGADIVNFAEIQSKLRPEEVARMLDRLYTKYSPDALPRDVSLLLTMMLTCSSSCFLGPP